jgi:hypothetical protein
MIPESESGQRPRPVRLPPRATPGVRPSPPPRWLVNPFALCRKGLRRVGTFAGARLRSFADDPQPWVFITGACVCAMLTFAVILVKNANDARPHPEVAQADAADTHDEIPGGIPARPQIAIMPKPAAIAKTAPAKETTLGALERLAKPDSHNAEEPKTRLKTLPSAEVEALNAGRRPDQAPRDGRPQAHEPVDGNSPGGPNPALARRDHAGAQFVLGVQNPGRAAANPNAANPVENGQDDFSQDPLTGVWFTPSGRWQIRGQESYRLPIEGKEVTRARFNLRASGITQIIELQWWNPRDVHEKRWTGKVAKLHFLAVTRDAQLHQAAEHVRVVQTRASNSDGALLVEVDALFYSPGWNLVANSIEEKPAWFHGNEFSIKRGDGGRLPVEGREIEVVRKALAAEEDQARTREVKWWPPRASRDNNGHRVSKLRYELIRGGDVQVDEIVYDHNERKISYAPRAVNLFPEFERRAIKLDQAPK